MPQVEPAERVRVGATVRSLRHARGLTGDQLAAAVGLSATYLYNIEAGRKPLPARHVRGFAHALGVAPAALVRPDLYGEQVAS